MMTFFPRFIQFFFVFFVIPIIFVSGYVFSANENECPACTSTPAILNSAITFSQSVLGVLVQKSQPPSANDILSQNQIKGPQKSTKQNAENQKYEENWVKGIKASKRRQKGIGDGIYEGLKKNVLSRKHTFQTIGWISRTLTLSNPGLGRSILFKPKSVRRDWAKLLQIDDKIQQAYIDIASQGELNTILYPEERKKILQLIQTHSQENGIFIEGGTVVGARATKRDVLKMLWTINATLKRFITIGGFLDVLSDEEIKELKKGDIVISFHRANAEKLRTEYHCARKPLVCTSSFKKFGQEMSKSAGELGNAGKEVVINIRESIIALRFALQGKRYKKASMNPQCSRDVDRETGKEVWKKGGGETSIMYIHNPSDQTSKKPYWTKKTLTSTNVQIVSEREVFKECNINQRNIQAKKDDRDAMIRYLQKERVLLQSQFGAYVNQANKDRSIRGLSDKITTPRQTKTLEAQEKIETKNSFSSANEENLAILFQQNNKKEEKIMKKIMEQYYEIDASKIIAINTLEQDFRQALFLTQSEQNAMTMQTLNADIRPITQAISSMTQKVRYATELVGDRNNPTSLVNLLGNACQMQCANLGGRCRSK